MDFESWLYHKWLVEDMKYAFRGSKRAYRNMREYDRALRGERNAVIINEDLIRIIVDEGYMVEIQRYGNDVDIVEYAWVDDECVGIEDVELKDVVWG